MKYVRETKAGKSISAWVILKRHREIATVQAYFSGGGAVLVNVFNYGDKNKSGKLDPQQGTAGGYGYDKLTAALTGLEIDGHKLSNHCQFRKTPPKGGVWPQDAKAPRGWNFANYRFNERVEIDGKFVTRELPKEKQGYSDCYRESGLKYLSELGYTVIQAI